MFVYEGLYKAMVERYRDECMNRAAGGVAKRRDAQKGSVLFATRAHNPSAAGGQNKWDTEPPCTARIRSRPSGYPRKVPNQSRLPQLETGTGRRESKYSGNTRLGDSRREGVSMQGTPQERLPVRKLLSTGRYRPETGGGGRFNERQCPSGG